MSEEIRTRLHELTAQLLLLSRHPYADPKKKAELSAEIMRLESQLPRKREPTAEEIRKAELERALREARGRELAALRSLHSPFGSWDEYRARREAYENALRERESLQRALEEES